MSAPLSRLMDEQPGLSPEEIAFMHAVEARQRLTVSQPRLDGSIHDPHICYECGASSADVQMDPICRFNVTTGGAEWRFCCAEIGPCSLRKAGVTQ